LNETSANEYLASLRPAGIQLGLERISALCAALGNPQAALPFVHLAGTNGKGSTSAMLAGILTAAGLRCGLFTTPFVTRPREQIAVDGSSVTAADFAHAVAEVRDAAQRHALQVSEFEATTAAAFCAFRAAGCDIAVLETGMGGRLDATNVIPAPLVSVLCPISLDHTAFLGDTLEKIAAEKCGILKNGSAAVCALLQPDAAMAVILAAAKEKDVPLSAPSLQKIEILGEDLRGTQVSYKGFRFRVPFVGRHMVRNAAAAVEAALLLREKGIAIQNSAIENGIAAAKLPARMELLSENPIVLLDGGHNAACAAALRDTLERFLPRKRIIALCAMMADKDAEGYLQTLAPQLDALFAVPTAHPRALPAPRLAKTAAKLGIPGRAESFAEAYETALYLARAHDGAVLVCGSFSLAAEAYRWREEML